MTVLTLAVSNKNDIPEQLEALAAAIREGGYGEVCGFVYAMTDGGDICADMFGKIGAIEASGLFALGGAMVANIYCEGLGE